jgi:hypothetical protein
VRKAKQMRKTNNILSKRRMLKITENRRSKVRDISNTTIYVNLLVTIVREVKDINE